LTHGHARAGVRKSDVEECRLSGRRKKSIRAHNTDAIHLFRRRRVFDKNDVGIVAMAFAHYMTQYGHDGPPETASAKQSIKGSLCHESGLTTAVCHVLANIIAGLSRGACHRPSR